MFERDDAEAKVDRLLKYLPTVLAEELHEESKEWAARALSTGSSEADQAAAQAVTQFADLVAQRLEDMDLATILLCRELSDAP